MWELFEEGKESPYFRPLSEEEARKELEEDKKIRPEMTIDDEKKLRYFADCSKFKSIEFSLQLQERLRIIDENGEEVGEEWRNIKANKEEGK
ncbi:MAG: hypothetical protein QXV17_13710 [Candidatus Micrarchaeaceae archaeon]